MYHFHRNVSHTKAKITPPRLGGEKIGVFSSRSPHRPCPIGLSLVKIDKICNNEINFYGTDMIDGTPVLDIKPYIPIYDSPNYLDFAKDNDFLNKREAPDGEETLDVNNIPTTSASQNIRIPNWIRTNKKLTVVFSEIAESQLIALNIEKVIYKYIYIQKKYKIKQFLFSENSNRHFGSRSTFCLFAHKIRIPNLYISIR